MFPTAVKIELLFIRALLFLACVCTYMYLALYVLIYVSLSFVFVYCCSLTVFSVTSWLFGFSSLAFSPDILHLCYYFILLCCDLTLLHSSASSWKQTGSGPDLQMSVMALGFPSIWVLARPAPHPDPSFDLNVNPILTSSLGPQTGIWRTNHHVLASQKWSHFTRRMQILVPSM